MSSASAPSRRLRLQCRATPEETIVYCSGRLTSEYAEEFKTKVHGMISGTKRLIVDFTSLDYMDSSGLGAVVRVYVSAKSAGCELRLVNFNQRIRDLLGLTGMLNIFADCGRFMVRMP